MSRERVEDLEDDYEVSLGLSDMEKEDEEAIDGLADMLAPMVLSAEVLLEETRLVVYRKPKQKLNLKKCVKSKGASKCRTSLSRSSRSLPSLRTSPTGPL
jgi:hypothetical protein